MNAMVNMTNPVACPASQRSRSAAHPAGTAPEPCTGNLEACVTSVIERVAVLTALAAGGPVGYEGEPRLIL
jgi:hypothetical protein